MTGVQRYTHEVSSRLGIEWEGISPHRVLGHVCGPLWDQSSLLWGARKGVLWSPANTGPILHPNHIVTIHDLAVLKDEPWFSKTYQLYYSKTVPLLLKNAAHVLTDSAFIRNEILNSFPLHEENVSVCRLGVDKRFFINPNVNSQNPYILAVGSLDPRKNFLRLFHAWESVCNRFPGFELHVVGGGTSIFKELDLSSLKMTQIKFIQRASDSELLDEYRSATAFVYPSLYEGFGLPVLEAMAAGLPVLTSEKSAMAEITGDLAVLVDPQSEESIAEGIVNLLKKQDLHSTLSIQGKERARDFSWDDTASSVTRILQKFGA